MSGSFAQAWSKNRSGSYIDREQSPYLQDIWSRGQTLSGRDPSQTVAGFTDPQLAAQQYTLDYAGNMPDQTPQARGAFDYALSAPQDPYFQQRYRSAVRPMEQEFSEQTIPGIRSSSIASGGYGSRTGIAEGLAARGLLDAKGDVASDLASSGYQTGMNTMMGALGMAPQFLQGMTQQDLTPAQLANMVGGAQQGMQQQYMDAPWLNMQRYSDLVGDPVSHAFGTGRSFSHSGSYSQGPSGG